MVDHLSNTAITLMYIFVEEGEGGSVSELSPDKQVKINSLVVFLSCQIVDMKLLHEGSNLYYYLIFL